MPMKELRNLVVKTQKILETFKMAVTQLIMSLWLQIKSYITIFCFIKKVTNIQNKFKKQDLGNKFKKHYQIIAVNARINSPIQTFFF